jgi:hypothetical protein
MLPRAKLNHYSRTGTCGDIDPIAVETLQQPFNEKEITSM